MYLKFSSFTQAQAAVVTLRQLIQCSILPSLDTNDVESCMKWLLFLYNRSESVFSQDQPLEDLLLKEFGLNKSVFSKLSNKGLTNTSVVVKKDGIVSTNSYLQPQRTDETTLSSYRDIIGYLKQFLSETEYNRLVQISYLSYPSPFPVIRDVIKRCNQDWVILFDKDPSGFCQSIRNSTQFLQHSYSFRSFRNSNVCYKHDME